jgi:hypothetical protein
MEQKLKIEQYPVRTPHKLRLHLYSIEIKSDSIGDVISWCMLASFSMMFSCCSTVNTVGTYLLKILGFNCVSAMTCCSTVNTVGTYLLRILGFNCVSDMTCCSVLRLKVWSLTGKYSILSSMYDQ